MKRSLLIILVFTLTLLLLSAVGTAQAYDFGGRTITYAWPWGPPAFDEGEALAHREWVEETFNVEFDFMHIPWDEMVETMISGVMAGDPVADIWYMSSAWLAPLVSARAVMEMDDILTAEYYDSLPRVQQGIARSAPQFAGRTYGFWANESPGVYRAIGWNKTLFEREGLPNLYELQDTKEWTWEKMKEIAVQATRDTTGDGEIDQWGFASSMSGWTLPLHWAYSNNAALTRVVDGRVVFAFDEPEALEAQEYLSGLFRENLVFPQAHPYAEENFYEGNIAIYERGPDGLYGAPDNMEDDYGLVLYPLGPNATEYTAPVWQTFYYVLPVTADNPAAHVEVTNALFELTRDYMIQTDEEYEESFVEGFSQYVRDRESLETFRMGMYAKEVIRQEHAAVGHAPVESFVEALEAVLAGEKRAAAAMAEVQPEVQAVIDMNFNQ